jgi:hypothetical protein
MKQRGGRLDAYDPAALRAWAREPAAMKGLLRSSAALLKYRRDAYAKQRAEVERGLTERAHDHVAAADAVVRRMDLDALAALPIVKKGTSDERKSRDRSLKPWLWEIDEHVARHLIERKAEAVDAEQSRVSFLDAAIAKADAALCAACRLAGTEGGWRTQSERVLAALAELEASFQGATKEPVRRQVAALLVDFAADWRLLRDSYRLNVLLTGGPGTGKSTLARVLGRCLHAFGILASDAEPRLVEKQDVIGQYVGTTAPLTYGVLYGGLEGVVFFDEAYAITGSGSADNPYGAEFADALTEFTQRFRGCLCVIAAGYKDDMESKFLTANAGLDRRFGSRVHLAPYSVADLEGILLKRWASPASSGVTDYLLAFDRLLLTLLGLGVQRGESVRQAQAHASALLAGLLKGETRLTFNLWPVLERLQSGSSEAKREIVKAFVLQRYVGLREGTVFPFQAADAVELGELIAGSPDVLAAGGKAHLRNTLATWNGHYLPRRGAVRVVVDVRKEPRGVALAVHLVPDGRRAADFEAVELAELRRRLAPGAPIDALYTEAVATLAARHEAYTAAVAANKPTGVLAALRLPYAVDSTFLAREYGRLRDARGLTPAFALGDDDEGRGHQQRRRLALQGGAADAVLHYAAGADGREDDDAAAAGLTADAAAAVDAAVRDPPPMPPAAHADAACDKGVCAVGKRPPAAAAAAKPTTPTRKARGGGSRRARRGAQRPTRSRRRR